MKIEELNVGDHFLVQFSRTEGRESHTVLYRLKELYSSPTLYAATDVESSGVTVLQKGTEVFHTTPQGDQVTKVEEGKYYRNRLGKVIGPMQPFIAGIFLADELPDGPQHAVWSDGRQIRERLHDHDFIEEVSQQSRPLSGNQLIDLLGMSIRSKHHPEVYFIIAAIDTNEDVVAINGTSGLSYMSTIRLMEDFVDAAGGELSQAIYL